ncbi:esterase/lipase family protein [Streptomyces sp. NPDC090029]|uniref:esterase/lipase family protein n=1 Tax=Streptomyces sp. NPDC090029 TaxID=3365924 RepID=UPI00381DD359
MDATSAPAPAPERLLHDAVVVVPGIMGSTLRDTDTDTPLWGVGSILGYSARLHSDRLRALRVTDAERSGAVRVEATGLLGVADWLPGLGGAQPYGDLLSRLRREALDRAAVTAFPYDWRLSVEHNGALLAAAVREHLAAWRAHGAHRRHLSEHPEAGPAKAVIVAHSMGGLLAREVVRDKSAAAEVRTVMTVGTPFGGSVKAAVMLNSGRGAPLGLPPAVLREVTPTMPGLYDLLPGYRCREEDGDMRAPEVDDIVALGGRRELAEASAAWRSSRSGTLLPDHVMVVGIGQRTWQSYRMQGTAAVAQRYMLRRNGERPLLDGDGRPQCEDRTGDGTVYQFAAHLPGSDARPVHVYQEHSALVRSASVVDLARGLLRGLRHTDGLGAMLGGEGFGLHVPEWVAEDQPFTVEVSGLDHSAADPECTVREIGGLERVGHPGLRPLRGTRSSWSALHRTDGPGLYEVEVRGGAEPLRRLVAVLAAVPG